MGSLKQKSNGIQVLRAVLFIGILAFHAGVTGSQILCVGGRELLCSKCLLPYKTF